MGNEKIIEDILAERKKQDIKWGIQTHDPSWWCLILGEEFGEACEAVLEAAAPSGTITQSWEEYRKELIHVAAVAVAALESFDKGYY